MNKNYEWLQIRMRIGKQNGCISCKMTCKTLKLNIHAENLNFLSEKLANYYEDINVLALYSMI